MSSQICTYGTSNCSMSILTEQTYDKATKTQYTDFVFYILHILYLIMLNDGYKYNEQQYCINFLKTVSRLPQTAVLSTLFK